MAYKKRTKVHEKRQKSIEKKLKDELCAKHPNEIFVFAMFSVSDSIRSDAILFSLSEIFFYNVHAPPFSVLPRTPSG